MPHLLPVLNRLLWCDWCFVSYTQFTLQDAVAYGQTDVIYLNRIVLSLAEFRELPFGPQMGLLARDGVPLLSHSVEGEQRVLFSFRTYYVDAGWDRTDRLQFVRSFKDTENLEPYLVQLDWHQSS